jgi:hypothetical protein
MTNNPRTGRPISSHGPLENYLSRNAVRELLVKHGFANVDDWVKIVMRESQGDPMATVDTRGMTDAELHAYWGPHYATIKLGQELSLGLFQLNVFVHRDPKTGDYLPGWEPLTLLDADANAAQAFVLSSGGVNFKPWGGKPA